jgi:hypothetical protein
VPEHDGAEAFYDRLPELEAASSRAGLTGVRWMGREESDCYPPLVVGTRP